MNRKLTMKMRMNDFLEGLAERFEFIREWWYSGPLEHDKFYKIKNKIYLWHLYAYDSMTGDDLPPRK